MVTREVDRQVCRAVTVPEVPKGIETVFHGDRSMTEANEVLQVKKERLCLKLSSAISGQGSIHGGIHLCGAPEYHFKFQSILSSDDNLDIWGNSIKAMEVMAGEMGITLPDNLFSRLFLVDEITYDDLIKQELGYYPTSDQISLGTTLPGRICILNDAEFVDDEAAGIYRVTTMTHAGAHELWHSLEHKSEWVSNLETPMTREDSFRRGGLKTKQPGHNPKELAIFSGLHLLNEGFTEWLTRRALKGAGEKPLNHYPEELKVVEMLIERIGHESFVKAYFTKEGYLSLARKLARLYQDKSALPHIAQLMYEDNPHCKIVAYQKTLEFIKRQRTANLSLL